MSEQALAMITSLQADVASLASSINAQHLSVSTVGQAAQAAADLAGSKGKVIVRDDAPVAADRLPQNLWIDTTKNANTPKRWNGSSWVPVTDKVASDAAAAAANAAQIAASKADTSTLTAQGQAITSLTSTIASSCNCRKAAATAGAVLDTTRIQSANNALSIDFGKGVITISHPSGSIVLEGGQVFVSETSVASAAIATEVTARASADEALFTRIGAISKVIEGSDLADVVRQVIRNELQPGGLLHRR